MLRPAQVIAIGANYAAHASELKLRSETAMTIFSLWPNSLAGHGSTTTWPEDLTKQVDYEAELGVIIGRPARGVHVRDALDHVWGYTVVNDITARDLQFSEAQWSRCKSFDGFTPTGPVVVTADEIADPQDLWLTTNLDGHILQDASTSEMVRSVAEIISYLSRSATIPAGTLISTGSPGGAGYSRNPQVFLHDGATVTSPSAASARHHHAAPSYRGAAHDAAPRTRSDRRLLRRLRLQVDDRDDVVIGACRQSRGCELPRPHHVS